jgi:hypothetical protein
MGVRAHFEFLFTVMWGETVVILVQSVVNLRTLAVCDAGPAPTDDVFLGENLEAYD